MLFGLMLNALVTAANAGMMPVVGMPSPLQPASPVWQAATSKTRLPFLADQAWLGLFSVGDLMLLSGVSSSLRFAYVEPTRGRVASIAGDWDGFSETPALRAAKLEWRARHDAAIGRNHGGTNYE